MLGLVATERSVWWVDNRSRVCSVQYTVQVVLYLHVLHWMTDVATTSEMTNGVNISADTSLLLPFIRWLSFRRALQNEPNLHDTSKSCLWLV